MIDKIVLQIISIHSPHTRGDLCGESRRYTASISIHSPHTRGDVCHRRSRGDLQRDFNPLPSYEGRRRARLERGKVIYFNPLPSYEGRPHTGGAIYSPYEISIHSPHTRGDSISLQKSIRIYVSLHNKTMIHRFSELYKPLFAAQSPIFGVRSPRESHDSFTFARPSVGRGITP